MTLTNPITVRTAVEVLSHEALVRSAYRDSVGKWTWSAGLTSATGHDVRRYINNPASLDKCLEVYLWALDRYADQVREAFTVPLTEEQFAAALSFHWNTGAIKRATWVKRFNSGDIAGARAAFMWYDKPKSIRARRLKEYELFFEGEWSSDGTTTEYTHVYPNGRIDWNSAKRIQVESHLYSILHYGMTRPVDVVVDPQPDALTEAQKATRPTILTHLRHFFQWLIRKVL